MTVQQMKDLACSAIQDHADDIIRLAEEISIQRGLLL